MYSTILLPLDGSELSERAVPHAVHLAALAEAEILVLRATTMPDRVVGPPDFSGPMLERYRDAEANSIAGYLKAWKQKIEAEGVACRTLCRLDEAAHAIISEAEACDADLIVMASHGRGGFDRWVHGSVAEKVLRTSPCPLLLVRVKPPASPPWKVSEGREAASAGS